jgi:hypothetical protein
MVYGFEKRLLYSHPELRPIDRLPFDPPMLLSVSPQPVTAISAIQGPMDVSVPMSCVIRWPHFVPSYCLVKAPVC